MKLKLSRDMMPGQDDWAMEGATEKRQHVTSGAIDPPLYEQWRYDVGAGVGPAGVLIVNDVVIAGTRKGMVHGVNLENGKRLGRIKHDAVIEGGLAVGDGLLFLPLAGDKKSVVAYDLDSGKKRWTLKGVPVEAGLLYTHGKLIAADAEANVIALEAATGEELWRTQLGERTTVTFSPLALDERLFIVDESGKMSVLRLEDGALLWERDLGSPVYNTGSTDGDLVFVPTTRGRLIAVDASHGDEAWRFSLPDTTVRFSTPAYTPKNDRLVVSATSGEVRALDARNGRELWKTSLDGAISAAPLITEHTVYVGTMRKHLHALDVNTGIELWSHEVTGRVKSALAGYGNRIVVMAETQQVIAFSPEEPQMEEETP